MFMIYISTQFCMSSSTASVIITIRAEKISCTTTILLFYILQNETLKKAINFSKITHHFRTIKHAVSVIQPHKSAVCHVMTNWKSFDAPLKGITFKQSFVKSSQMVQEFQWETMYRHTNSTQKANIFLFKTKSDFNLPISELMGNKNVMCSCNFLGRII